MRDLEYNRYDEYGSLVPEQTPSPEETQKTLECGTQAEQYAHAEYGVDAPALPRAEKKKTSGRMAMQFMSICLAALLVVTAGAALSEGTFLPELGVRANAVMQRAANTPVIATKQSAKNPGAVSPADAAGEPSPGNEPPSEIGLPPPVQTIDTTPERPAEVLPVLPSVSPPVSPPIPPTKPTVKPARPVKPIVSPKPVKPIKPVIPPKPVVPPVKPPVVPPVKPPVEPPVVPPIVPPVEPPVNPPYEPDPDPTPPDPPHSHSYSQEVTQPATCGTAGETTYTCAACGYRYTEPIPATGAHHYTYVSVDNAEHKQTCTVCKLEGAAAAHALTEAVTSPTCNDRGYTTHTCSVCAHTWQDAYTDATGNHTYGPWTDAGDGTTHQQTCTGCNKKMVENHAMKDATIPATCTQGGSTTSTCDRCSYASAPTNVTSPLGHAYADTVVPPTCGTEGYTSHICSRCNDKQANTNTVAATGLHEVTTWTDKDNTNHEGTCTVCSQPVTEPHTFPAGGKNCTSCNTPPGIVTITAVTRVEPGYKITGKFSWKNGDSVVSSSFTYVWEGDNVRINLSSVGHPDASGNFSVTTDPITFPPGTQIKVEMYFNGRTLVATGTYIMP